MSDGLAPSCPISHSQPTSKPQQPGHVDVANIPPARDLRSVITAINMMNSVIQHITRGAPQINNIYPVKIEGIPDPVPPPPPQYARLTWRETDRGYREQKVVNPEDADQYVEIKTLTHVKWVEDVTGHTLIYKGQ